MSHPDTLKHLLAAGVAAATAPEVAELDRLRADLADARAEVAALKADLRAHQEALGLVDDVADPSRHIRNIRLEESRANYDALSNVWLSERDAADVRLSTLRAEHDALVAQAKALVDGWHSIPNPVSPWQIDQCVDALTAAVEGKP